MKLFCSWGSKYVPVKYHFWLDPPFKSLSLQKESWRNVNVSWKLIWRPTRGFFGYGMAQNAYSGKRPDPSNMLMLFSSSLNYQLWKQYHVCVILSHIYLILNESWYKSLFHRTTSTELYHTIIIGNLSNPLCGDRHLLISVWLSITIDKGNG